MPRLAFVLEAFAGSASRQTFHLDDDGHYAITTDEVSLDIAKCDAGDHGESLASLTVHGFHITLQASCGPCTVVPSLPPGFPTPSKEGELAEITLPQSAPDRQYFVLLRPDDRVILRASGKPWPICTLKVQVDDVQVESSLPIASPLPVAQEQSAGRLRRLGREKTAQQESEGPDLSNKAPIATPVAPSTVSQVVNETPATARRCKIDDGASSSGNVIIKEKGVNIFEEPESARNVPTKIQQTDIPEDREEEGDDITASESENEDDPNEEQIPNQPCNPSNPIDETELYSTNCTGNEEIENLIDQDHVLSRRQKAGPPRVPFPRVEIPATRGHKRAALEEDPQRATKKQAFGGARRESASGTPPSSNHSRRSAANDYDKNENVTRRIVFSNSTVNTRPSTLKFLSRRGVQILDNVTCGCDYLCVNASGQLKKSFKLLMSVVLGKPIISEDWVVTSINSKKIVDPEAFITTNAPSEWHWGNTIHEVTAALERDRSKLFEGIEILVTPKLKKDYGGAYKDIEQLLKKCGAAKVVSKQARAQDPKSATVIVGSENNDADAIKLTNSDDEWSCFSKELISMSILRGKLDLDSDEFKLQSTKSGNRGKSGRPKKIM